MRTVDYCYQIFIPSGNDTAIVFGTNFTKAERKLISDSIMNVHSNIEQVGFVSDNPQKPVFFLAGGGFCGNGTRSAVYHYLNGKQGDIRITIPEVAEDLHAGISKSLETWTEVPLQPLPRIEETPEGYYIVRLPEISHLIIPSPLSIPYLKKQECLRYISFDLLASFDMIEKTTCGAIYLENEKEFLKINPYVHDQGVGTMFRETACGSGTAAVGILQAFLKKTDLILPVLQPSGKIITANITMDKGRVTKAIISGKVTTDNKIHFGTVSVEN